MDIRFENKRNVEKGVVLLSDPFSNDEYFGRSVVYLCDHNSEGSFGFVLTNYLDIKLSEVAKNFPNVSTKVSVGGPVDTQNIFFIHTLGNIIDNTVEIKDGIFIGGNYDQLVNLIEEKQVSETDVRFFLGYSGWSKNQLNNEIDEHAWIVAPVLNNREIIDTNTTNLYNHFMRREGKKYDILANFPSDFTAN